MDSVDEVPVVLGHLGEGHVPEDAGVVVDDVDPGQGVLGLLDDAPPSSTES